MNDRIIIGGGDLTAALERFDRACSERKDEPWLSLDIQVQQETDRTPAYISAQTHYEITILRGGFRVVWLFRIKPDGLVPMVDEITSRVANGEFDA